MGKDILGMYNDNSLPTKPSKANSMVGGGGAPNERDVMNYAAPVIPGWDPHSSKRPGLGGANLGCCGTQGRYSGNDNAKQTTPPIGDGAGGNVGIKRPSGEGRGMGTNRKG